MKNKILIMFALGASLLGCVNEAPAQTNIPPQTPQTFITSVQSYFTDFDTNSTTFANPIDIWTAENYRANVNSSAELGASYDIWKAVSVEAAFRNAGIAGTVVSEQGGFSLSLKHYDVKITGYVDIGYSQYDQRMYCEFGARAKKALTSNTYAGIGIALQELFGKSKASGVNTTQTLPTFTAFLGFTLPGF